jgi:hypothetical protein
MKSMMSARTKFMIINLSIVTGLLFEFFNGASLIALAAAALI